MQQDDDTEVLAQATEGQKCHLLRWGRLNDTRLVQGAGWVITLNFELTKFKMLVMYKNNLSKQSKESGLQSGWDQLGITAPAYIPSTQKAEQENCKF